MGHCTDPEEETAKPKKVVEAETEAEPAPEVPKKKWTGACGGELAQCGGKNWEGADCCLSGLECTEFDEFYSMCQGTATGKKRGKGKKTEQQGEESDNAISCRWEGEQCGGKLWKGATCCRTGLSCQKQTKWYSNCVSDTDSEEGAAKTGKGK